MDITQVSVADLASRCAEETGRFLAQQRSDTRFCFELFRRALVEQDEGAFQHIYTVFQRHVLGWISRDAYFTFYTRRGGLFCILDVLYLLQSAPGRKFTHFNELSHLLSYLRDCAHTTILQYIRQQRHHDTQVALDQARTLGESEAGATAQLDAQQLWQHIEQLLNNAQERQVAYAVFVLGYKPRELPAAFPALISDAHAASQLLYRIRQRLRNDPLLRRWFES